MAHKVFICHSSKDKAVADAACAALEAERIACWIAPRDVLPGRPWADEIIQALSSCEVVLLIFSLDADKSPQVQREIERAVHYQKILVPFRIQNVLPTGGMEYALSNTHWLDAMTPPMEHRLGELCRTVSKLVEVRPQVEPSRQRAANKPAEQNAASQSTPPAPTSKEHVLLPILRKAGFGAVVAAYAGLVANYYLFGSYGVWGGLLALLIMLIGGLMHPEDVGITEDDDLGLTGNAVAFCITTVITPPLLVGAFWVICGIVAMFVTGHFYVGHSLWLVDQVVSFFQSRHLRQ